MRTLVAVAFAVAWLLAAVPIVAASPGRADTFYTVNCIDPDGNHVLAESVDAHAIERGGKLGAIQRFTRAQPGWTCWAEGPFHN